MWLIKKSSLFILTGAGISAQSGLSTFRGTDGLWENHRIEDVATPEGFIKDKTLIYRFYNERRRQASCVVPNSAHSALAALQSNWQGRFLLVTQNVDDLHERAGSTNVIHMHGSLFSGLCNSCRGRFEWHGDMNEQSQCPLCSSIGTVRPDVVWFGEQPYRMELIQSALSQCDIFLSIGTSGQVYPAAGFADFARECGAYCVDFNSRPNAHYTALFDKTIIGEATTTVVEYVHDLLNGTAI